jgi:hypothetical protein
VIDVANAGCPLLLLKLGFSVEPRTFVSSELGLAPGLEQKLDC